MKRAIALLLLPALALGCVIEPGLQPGAIGTPSPSFSPTPGAPSPSAGASPLAGASPSPRVSPSAPASPQPSASLAPTQAPTQAPLPTPSPSAQAAVTLTVRRLTQDGAPKYGLQVSPTGNAAAWLEEPSPDVTVIKVMAPLGSAPREVFRTSNASNVGGYEGPQKSKFTADELAAGPYILQAWHLYLRFSPDGSRLLFPVREGNVARRYDDWAVIDVASGTVGFHPIVGDPAIGPYDQDGNARTPYYTALESYGHYGWLADGGVVYMLKVVSRDGVRAQAVVTATLGGSSASRVAGVRAVDPQSGVLTPGELPVELDRLSVAPGQRELALRAWVGGQPQFFRQAFGGTPVRLQATDDRPLTGPGLMLADGAGVYVDQGVFDRQGMLAAMNAGSFQASTMPFHDGRPGVWSYGVDSLTLLRPGEAGQSVPVDGVPAGWHMGLMAFGSEYDHMSGAQDGRTMVVPITDGTRMDLLHISASR